MRFIKYLVLFWSVVCNLSCNLANTQDIVARAGSYGIDETKKIIVWHEPAIDSISDTYRKIDCLIFDKKYTLEKNQRSLSYEESYDLSDGTQTFSLYISQLPLIHITTDTLNDRSKTRSKFTYYNGTHLLESTVGIEYRGNLSLTFPKKTYDLEFWTDSIPKKNRDVQFMHMRNDDDWILDGLYNEPLRIRSYFANKLWSSIHKPYYSDRAPTAKSTIASEFVEVFNNNEYLGVYALMESVDRKLLALTKNDTTTTKGELFKASFYEGGPAFEKSPEFNTTFPHWNGFEYIYPIIDYKYQWKNLAELTNLVVHASEEEFKERIANKFYIANAIDYFLFINLMRGTDNLGKNYYLAKYDENDPYFIVPWDLDGVMGTIQDGKRIATTDDILTNGLFDRLLQENPESYRERLKERWKDLRRTVLKNDRLLGEMDKLISYFKDTKIYEREFKAWPDAVALEDHCSYIETWLKQRLLYLDSYVESL